MLHMGFVSQADGTIRSTDDAACVSCTANTADTQVTRLWFMSGTGCGHKFASRWERPCRVITRVGSEQRSASVGPHLGARPALLALAVPPLEGGAAGGRGDAHGVLCRLPILHTHENRHLDEGDGDDNTCHGK